MGEGRRDRTRWPSTPRELYSRQALVSPEVLEVGLAHFFCASTQMQDLQQDIQQQLRELDSELDLVALEQPGSEALRLFIDHPQGVDLALCEKVTRHLNHLRAEYSLEVSSPGPKYSNRKEIQ
jgi:RimP N-terminal domain